MNEPTLRDSRAEEMAKELERANLELEMLSHALSHDLQSLLRGVAAMAQLLAEDFAPKLGPEGTEILGSLRKYAKQTLRLTGELSAYVRLSRMRNPFQLVDCEELYKSLVADFKATIEESGAILTHDPLPKLMGDTLLLRQLFGILVGNAIKFRGGRPPKIQVSVKPTETEWQFSVQDNGIGIDLRFSGGLFGLFRRFHDGTEHAGTGIGLASAKKIVERHGGRIWVESTLGQGSTFYFTIRRMDSTSSAAARPTGIQLPVFVATTPELEKRFAAIEAASGAIQEPPVAATFAEGHEPSGGNALAPTNQGTSGFLQFAGLEKPNLVIITAPAFLEGLRELVAPYLAAMKIRLTIKCEGELRVRGDPGQLRDVLNELIQNAADSIAEDRELRLARAAQSISRSLADQATEHGAQETESSGRITVRADRGEILVRGFRARAVILEVEDKGPGIPLERQSRLFEPHSSTKPGRAGLGLARSARIVENQGGILDFQTQAGKGTTFRIALPAEAPP